MNKGLSHPGLSILREYHLDPLLPTISPSTWTIKGNPSNQVLLSSTVTQGLLFPCIVSTKQFHLFLNKTLCNFAIHIHFSNTSLIPQYRKNSNWLLGFLVTPLLGNSGGYAFYPSQFYLSQGIKRA